MEPLADWLTRREHVTVASLADADAAAHAIGQLLGAGIPQPQVSLIALDRDATRALLERHTEFGAVVVASATSLSQEAEASGTEELRAALYGAGLGVALTMVSLAVPGFGPAILAGGPLAVVRTALWLATAGGGLAILVGAILDDRGSEEHRAAYQADLERGGWLVAVHGTRALCDRAAGLLRALGPSRLEVL
jgi:hypothetical protein